MVDRFAQYGTLALKVAYEKLGHWARSTFASEDERARSLAKMEKEIAEALYSTLSQLRGTAAKLGQQISLESGLLPTTYQERLESLHNSLTPLSFATIRKVIVHDFGRPPEEVFRDFEPTAFAAASLGQVHRARLHSGPSVAVKVLYPGTRNAMKADLAMLRKVLGTFADHPLLLRTLAELENRLMDEVNYRHELNNTLWFNQQFRDPPNLVLPCAFREFCSDNVLTTEFVDGTPLRQLPAGQDRDRAGQLLFDFFCRGIFELGAVHADPHPGNFLWNNSTQTLGVIDFGAAKTHIDPDALELFHGLLDPQVTSTALIPLYARLGAQVEKDDVEFAAQVIEPYKSILRPLFGSSAYRFDKSSTLARDLRMILFTQAFHSQMKTFSTEFTMLHKTLYGVISLLTRLEATIVPKTR